MGKNGLNTILSTAGLDGIPSDNMARQFDFALMAALSLALEQTYGPRGGRGIALRIGRAMFSLGIKDFGVMIGMRDARFQALPLNRRTDLGLLALATIFNQFSDQQCHLEAPIEQHHHFVVAVSPFAWGRTAEGPVCHALTGIIQESLRWASNGYEYHAQEIACQATGSEHCVFKINRTPIGQGR